MAGDGEGAMETIMSKSGVELFREMLRVMGDADVEDYYKAGVWKDELMRLDLQLVYAHRKEGGAPEPSPLAEVPMPELPGGVQVGAPGGLAGQLAARIAALKAGGSATAAAAVAAAPAEKKPVEPNDGPDWLEVALKKSGGELFRELLRVMGDADEEDYVKAGAWLDDLLRLDLRLVVAHRTEAGAPSIPALKDVREPILPGGAVLGVPGGLAGQLAARVAALKAGGGATAAVAVAPAVRKPVEPNDGPDWLEVAVKKSGGELFREILRVVGDADEEDYVKAGAWQDDLMRLDLKLIVAHRKQGGAPSIPALKDVREPILPAVAASAGASGVIQIGSPAGASVSPSGATLAARVAQLKAAAAQGGVIAGPAVGAAAGPALAFKPPIQIGSQPAPITVGSVGTAAVSSAAVGATGAEDRLTTLFATKWKLELARVKLILSQLSPPRRRYVIQKFQTTDSGAAAFEHLETFIAECELTNAWEAAEAISASPKPAAAVGAPARPAIVSQVQIGAGVGVKRPLITAALNAAKRPCINVAAAPPAAAAAPLNAIAQRLAAARAKIAADKANGGTPQTAGAFAGGQVMPWIK